MEAYTQTKPISEIAESSHNGNSKLQAMMQQINDKDKNGHEDIENDQIAQKETHPDQEGENESNLIPELNCLSWPEWRKLRLSEYEFETRQKDGTKKENQEEDAKPRPRKYVIDIVTDAGDMGPPAYTGSQLSSKAPRLFGRIRINSQHILDVLGDITNVFLPAHCQMLHPFKVIIDNLTKIQDHMKIIEHELKKSKAASQHNIPAFLERNKPSHEAIGVKTQSDGTNQDKTLKSKAKTGLEVAQERFDHYRCFMELIKTKLSLEVNVARAVKEGTIDKIMFCHLWFLFPPGETIYYQKQNRDEPPQAAQVLKVSGGRAKLPNAPTSWLAFLDPDGRRRYLQKVSPFTIDAFHLDFDGKKYRPFQVKYEIPKYPGEFPITSLPVFPLRFLPESSKTATISLLLNRGLNFRNLASVEAAHREYHGRTLDSEPEDIDGRVIVDFKQASIVDNLQQRNSHPNSNDGEDAWRVFGLRPLSQTSSFEVSETLGTDQDDLTLYDDHMYDIDRTEKLFSVNKVLLAPSQELVEDDLGDDELRLLPGSVYAYVLRSRKYCRCDISFIKEITPNQKAMDSLVLPTKHKNLLMSLVDRHSLGSRPVEQKTNTDRPSVKRTDSRSPAGHGVGDTLSIVKGKGRGLIILLHGVPGVGKTSTAETIAETTGRPLLPVTCGDIGENASTVEKNLEQIFTNSHRWGCVLLLDEAEVFLTKRNLQDLTRNAMVSVFLRALEFYSGILFLTTNRVGTIDEAFKSRIHISLYYPPHDWKTSKQIWQVNLERCMERVQADKDEILRYAKKQFHRSDENSRWNGRQIYNAFKTAIALAEFEKSNSESNKSSRPILMESHFRQVAQVAKKFDEYLLETHGGVSMAATNQQQNVRADGFGIGEDGDFKLKRRPTKTRKLDYDEMSTTSEDDSNNGSDISSGTEDEESEIEVKKSRRKGASSTKKSDGKKKLQSSKSKKSSKRHIEDKSEESS
ncbi:P-loop containing nucleoside triphosphate hydrolase protein [Nemania diffusa]|nr:P-loop containing nucleoside triphosphate hydrolase protein [Nemania diffusa]